MIIIENQSLLDVAIQEHGNAMTAFDWCLQNGLSITDDLVPGQKLTTPISEFRNADVAGYFEGKNQKIATGFNAGILDLLPELGIGTMAIETTFIVQ